MKRGCGFNNHLLLKTGLLDMGAQLRGGRKPEIRCYIANSIGIDLLDIKF